MEKGTRVGAAREVWMRRQGGAHLLAAGCGCGISNMAPETAVNVPPGADRPRAEDAPGPLPRGRAGAGSTWAGQALCALVTPGRRRLCAALLALYLAVTALGVATHEPWHDEAQKWLIARDTGSLRELFRLLPLEGSPGLWPLLLRPLARGGLPYASMQWLNWAVMGGAAALLLFSAPLPWPLKTGVLLSHFLLYQYPVIASNYSLSVLFIIALLSLYPARRSHPFAVGSAALFLANSTVAGAVCAVPIAAILVWEALRERRPAWSLALPIAAGFALCALQVLPARLGEGASFDQVVAPQARPDLLEVLHQTFFAPIPMAFPGVEASHETWAFLVLAFYSLLIVGMARRPRALFLLLATTALLLAFLSRFAVGTRHQGFLFLAVVCALWLAWLPEGKAPGADGRLLWASAVAAVVLGFSTLISPSIYAADVRQPYSCSRAMAEFIRSRGLERLPAAAFPSGSASALLPYLPGVRFYYPGTGGEGTYVRQYRKYTDFENASLPEALARIFGHYPPGAPFLLLLNQPAPGEAAGRCALLHRAEHRGAIHGENYWLYICNRHPEKGEG